MPSTGLTFPGTAVNDSSFGTLAWSNPGNVTASSGTANVFATSTSDTNYLKATNFGFAIPTGATIDGVEVKVRGFATATNAARAKTLRLVKGGSVVGNNEGDNSGWIAFATTKSFGSSANLWGVTLTPADVNASDFGVVYSANMFSKRSHNVIKIEMEVHYTLPANRRVFLIN